MARKKVENTEEVEVVEVDTEKEELKKQLEMLQLQMQTLMQAQTNQNAITNLGKSKRNIKFISLCPGITVIRGNKDHVFEKQFSSKSIPETEAYAIVNTMEKAIETGMIYIADAKFVEDCELDGIYTDILSDEQLKNLLKSDANTVCEVYKNANNTQKKIIVDMITDRRLNGQEVDANILLELKQLTGKDFFEIEPLDKG